MKVRMRKTTFDSEIGHMRPGMVVEVNKSTGERWVKYRIADEVEGTPAASPEAKQQPVENEVYPREVTDVVDPGNVNTVDLEMLTKSEIRELAEKHGVTLPIKANKIEMIKRLDGVDLS